MKCGEKIFDQQPTVCRHCVQDAIRKVHRLISELEREKEVTEN